MIDVRSRSLAGAALALSALGVVLLWYGDHLRQDAAAGLREASFWSVSRTRAVDQIPASADERRAEDGAAVERWVGEARDSAEGEVLEALRDCVSLAGSDCDAELAAAREHYASALQAQWSRSSSDNDSADWILLLAASSFVLGTLLSLATRQRGSASGPGPGADASVPEGPDESVAAVDVMLRRRLEELYAARLRAWESDRFAAYGELAAGLSHGLKTPLASIRAAAQVAVKKLGEDHPVASQLEDVIAEVDGLVEQIRRFLQATGSGEPVPARVSPGQLVEAIESGYAADANDRGVSLRTEVADSLGMLLVDAALLEMALRNLVENALAAAPKASTVLIAAAPSEAPRRAGLDSLEPPEGEWIEIVVSDEGGGIPEEALAGGRVPSRKPDGSGLGLAIARRIVARHGGALVVDTGEGVGTSVRVLLPAATSEAGA